MKSSGDQPQSCRPPTGHTWLTIGQDVEAITDYLDTVQHIPDITENKSSAAAVMVYSDIQTLRGLDAPADYGSGIEFANGNLDLLRGERKGLQIGLWLNGTKGCQEIVSGSLNKNIKKLVLYLETSPASKIFLRIGYEFDNPEFGYFNPLLFRQAYTRIANGCLNRPRCRSKTQFVWHSWGAGGLRLENATLKDYYPGDRLVDWVGVSVFSQFQNQLGTVSSLELVLNFAKEHTKPVMIAESTIFGGVTEFEDPWAMWFQPVLNLIGTYDISMWSYINCDWDSQKMWKGVGFGDTRLSTNATVLRLWNEHVLQNERYITGNITCELSRSLQEKRSFISWYTGPILAILLALLCGSIFRQSSGQPRRDYQQIQ